MCPSNPGRLRTRATRGISFRLKRREYNTRLRTRRCRKDGRAFSCTGTRSLRQHPTRMRLEARITVRLEAGHYEGEEGGVLAHVVSQHAIDQRLVADVGRLASFRSSSNTQDRRKWRSVDGHARLSAGGRRVASSEAVPPMPLGYPRSQFFAWYQALSRRLVRLALIMRVVSDHGLINPQSEMDAVRGFLGATPGSRVARDRSRR